MTCAIPAPKPSAERRQPLASGPTHQSSPTGAAPENTPITQSQAKHRPKKSSPASARFTLHAVELAPPLP